jgi:hypothetical protein
MFNILMLHGKLNITFLFIAVVRGGSRGPPRPGADPEIESGGGELDDEAPKVPIEKARRRRRRSRKAVWEKVMPLPRKFLYFSSHNCMFQLYSEMQTILFRFVIEGYKKALNAS